MAYTNNVFTYYYTNDVFYMLCVFTCYFLNKMEGDMAHGIIELVKGTLFPLFWLFHWRVFYQADFFLHLLKFIYSIDQSNLMTFLFVICIFLTYKDLDFQASKASVL